MLTVSIILALIVLLIGSITDIQKREVHDYVSYSLIILAFAASILYSIIYKDYIILLNTAFGFIIGLIIAYAMFYLGQWGGGDSKLMMGLGAIIGFNPIPGLGINYWILLFIISLVFVGSFYGLLWSLYLAIKNRARFMTSLKDWTMKPFILLARRILLVFTILAIVLIFVFYRDFYRFLMISVVAMIFIIFYVWLFVKIVEESCLIKEISTSKLTEGDWVFKDVYHGKKYLAGPKDLGVSKEQIVLLKKFKKKITIKEGIPFIPAFLIAFVVLVVMYYSGLSYAPLMSLLG